jgi:hypothetical protein
MDSGTDWIQVVIVPAIVAGVVALAIEYAAKPSLEARKERVLRTQRSLWELRDGLITLTDRLDTLDYWIRSGDIDVASVERDIDSVREELGHVEALGAIASTKLPSAIWAEFSFAVGRHHSMFETPRRLFRAFSTTSRPLHTSSRLGTSERTSRFPATIVLTTPELDSAPPPRSTRCQAR